MWVVDGFLCVGKIAAFFKLSFMCRLCAVCKFAAKCSGLPKFYPSADSSTSAGLRLPITYLYAIQYSAYSSNLGSVAQ